MFFFSVWFFFLLLFDLLLILVPQLSLAGIVGEKRKKPRSILPMLLLCFMKGRPTGLSETEVVFVCVYMCV
jgi:hypothetical protein